jgi:hypothetical protein
MILLTGNRRGNQPLGVAIGANEEEHWAIRNKEAP